VIRFLLEILEVLFCFVLIWLCNLIVFFRCLKILFLRFLLLWVYLLVIKLDCMFRLH